MKHLSYYCGDYLKHSELQTLHYTTALYRKIGAGLQTIQDLQQIHFLKRDSFRIRRICKAIDDWNEQLQQVYEKDE